MTELSEIIDAASDDGYSISNLLRKVQTVAHRLKARSVSDWVKWELFGYQDSTPVPSYRAASSARQLRECG